MATKKFTPKQFQRKRQEAAIGLRRQITNAQSKYGMFTVLSVLADYLDELTSHYNRRAFSAAIKKHGRKA